MTKIEINTNIHRNYEQMNWVIVGPLYGVPHGILRVFNTILYENEFQNPQIFQQTISLFPEHSTLRIPHVFWQYKSCFCELFEMFLKTKQVSFCF
jgi:hypothetical protein